MKADEIRRWGFCLAAGVMMCAVAASSGRAADKLTIGETGSGSAIGADISRFVDASLAVIR
jgi:hypothetical protein